MLKNYSIAIHESAQIDDVARRLTRQGFDVTSRLDAIGVIVGSTDDSNAPAIRAIDGVAAMEEQREFGLSDGDSDA